MELQKTVIAIVLASTFAGADASALVQTTAQPPVEGVQSLCVQTVASSGIEADIDARIAAATAETEARLENIVSPGDQALQAYEAALREALPRAKEPVMEALLRSCASTFTMEELEQINAFYGSAAGQAWLEKGRAHIVPAIEAAIVEIEPAIREDIERGYCARMGC